MSLFKGENPKLGTTVINPSFGADVGLTVQAADAGQTANLLELKNSAGTTVASISNAGLLTVASATGQRVVLTTELLAASVDKWLFVADRAYIVTSVGEIHSVAGGAAAAVRPRKITAASTAAPGAVVAAGITEITSAAIDLTTTANTSQAGALSATASDFTLAVGDKIGLDFSGTLTGLVGSLTIVLKAV
jgi:hypothetical protein